MPSFNRTCLTLKNRKHRSPGSPKFPRVSEYKHMITVSTSDFNKDLDQESYYKLVALICLNLFQLTCPLCGCSGFLHPHGWYTRGIIIMAVQEAGILVPQTMKIKIRRVICKHCNHTHALLPVNIVPYCQIPLTDQIQVIKLSEEGKTEAEIAEEVPVCDENNIKHIKQRFKKIWFGMLASQGISIASFPDLVRSCFEHYSKQFMEAIFRRQFKDKKIQRNSLFISPQHSFT